MASLKDTLKNCKSVKNSDKILDELFSSIKEEKGSEEEEDESENDGSGESSDEDREKKKHSDSESDTEEFKRLKEMKKVQNFVVKGDGMVEGPIADTCNFEYDPVTRMYKKKDGLVELETRRNFRDEEKKEEDDKWKSDEELEREKKELKKKEYLEMKEMEKKKKENGEEENVDAKKDEIMDELVKEIEELENEVSGNSEVDTDKEKEADGGGIDWGSSALAEIII